MAPKKNSSIPIQERIHICYICGKEIHGEHVEIKTKREAGWKELKNQV